MTGNFLDSSLSCSNHWQTIRDPRLDPIIHIVLIFLNIHIIPMFLYIICAHYGHCVLHDQIHNSVGVLCVIVFIRNSHKRYGFPEASFPNLYSTAHLQALILTRCIKVKYIDIGLTGIYTASSFPHQNSLWPLCSTVPDDNKCSKRDTGDLLACCAGDLIHNISLYLSLTVSDLLLLPNERNHWILLLGNHIGQMHGSRFSTFSFVLIPTSSLFSYDHLILQ